MAEVTARGLTFHVQRLGGGEPCVVFIHGLVMDNLSSWYFTVANPMARQGEAILYDLRGHGMSGRPADGYTIPDLVADQEGLLDALGVERPVWLVGNSFGGLIALSFAIDHPERTAGLVLVDAQLNDDAFGAQMAATLGLEGEERDQKILESFRHWLGRHSRRKRTRLAATAEALVHGTSMVADLREGEPITDQELSGLDRPVLALYGERSDALDRGRRLVRALPDCTLEVLPGCTHSVLWEATEQVKDRIVGWIGEQE